MSPYFDSGPFFSPASPDDGGAAATGSEGNSEELNAAIAEIKRLNREFLTLEKIISELRANSSAEQNERRVKEQQLNDELLELQRIISSLREDNAAEKSDNRLKQQKLNDDLDELQRINSGLRDENAAEKSDNRQKQQKLNDDLDELQRINSGLRDDNAAEKSDNRQKQQSLNDDIRKLHSINSGLRDRNKSGQLDNRRLREEVNDRTTDIAKGKRLLQEAIDGTTDTIQVFRAVRDEDNRIIDFIWRVNNAKAIEQNGDVIGMSLLSKNPGVVETGIFEKMVSVVESGETIEHEQFYAHEQFNGWFYQALVKSNDGVVMTSRDITSSKNSELEILRLKEEIASNTTDRYYSLFNSIEEGFCIIEMLYDESGTAIDYRFVEVNNSFENQTGLIDVVGKTGRELTPGTEPYWIKEYEKVAKTGHAISYENYHKPTAKWYQAYATRVSDKGDLVAILFTNITQRKVHEQRQDFFIKLNDILRPMTDHVTIRQEAMKLLRSYLQCTLVAYSVVSADEEFVTPVAEDSVPEFISMLGMPFRWTDFEPEGPARFRRGKSVSRNDIQQDSDLSGKQKAAFASVGINSYILTPIVKEGKLVACIAAYNKDVRNWTTAELHLLEEVADRTWTMTERAIAQQELLKSEEKYRNLFNSIDEGFCIFEIIYKNNQAYDWRYVEANPAVEKHTGLKDIIGKTGRELTPGTSPMWLEFFDKVLRTGEIVHFEDYDKVTDRWYDVHVIRVGEPQNRLISTIFSDITERRQREKQKEYMLQLNEAVRSLNDATEIEASISRMAMNYFNADRCYYCTIEGDDAIINRDAHGPDLPSVSGTYPFSSFKIFKKVVDQNQPFVVHDAHTTDILDEPLRNLCIQLKVISFIDIPVIKNGIARGILCIVQSEPRKWTEEEVQVASETAERIWSSVERAKAESKLKQSEEKLRYFNKILEDEVQERTAQLKRSNEDLLQFAHVASHDLKEPVRKIKTFNNRLLNEYGAGLDKKAITYINKVANSADRMLSMIEGVLLYSKLEHADLQLEMLDLSAIIKQVKTDLELLIQRRNAIIKEYNLPMLSGAYILIHQLFYNLILNSLKFARKNIPPEIEITADLFENQAGAFHRIVLIDNGIGFEQEFAEVIFKTFSRLNAVDEYEGSGLGLALCKKIVERHHGSISAVGDIEKGAKFIILLPVR